MGTHWFTHSQWGFNPRAREGRDILTLHKMADLKDVSIHAPARGATRELCGLGVFAREFQSTRPRGARQEKFKECNYAFNVSIHAPARGATLVKISLIVARISFNPRAREGRDLDCC